MSGKSIRETIGGSYNDLSPNAALVVIMVVVLIIVIYSFREKFTNISYAELSGCGERPEISCADENKMLKCTDGCSQPCSNGEFSVECDNVDDRNIYKGTISVIPSNHADLNYDMSEEDADRLLKANEDLGQSDPEVVKNLKIKPGRTMQCVKKPSQGPNNKPGQEQIMSESFKK